MTVAKVNELSPQEAWMAADTVYKTKIAESSKEVGATFASMQLKAFEYQDLMVQGVSGPMPLQTVTGFAFVGKGTAQTGRPGEALIATRGTDSLADVWTDLNGAFTRSRTNGSWIHSGFNDTYNSFRGTLLNWIENNQDVRTVHCVGHSLGGALATLVAEELSAMGKAVALYTFGSPRVGIQGFAEHMRKRLGTNMYRVANIADPVTMVGPWLYTHIPSPSIYPVAWKGASVSFAAHKMTNYKDGIQDAGWANLARIPEPDANESEIKGLLAADDSMDRITMYSMPGLYMINKCLTYLVRKAARFVPVAVMAHMTVLDKLSYLLYTGYAASNGDSESYSRLMGWILKFLGRPAATMAEVSIAFVRWCLGSFLSVINSLAWRAVQTVHRLPGM
jgi:triacylglycerol lipase